MEIKGEEFLKNIQIKQENENTNNPANHIDENEPAAYVQTSQNVQQNMQEEQELTNIMLEESVPPSNNEGNKKKYLILGLILIILFLTTILMIRLLNDDSSSNNDFENEEKKATIKSDSSIDEEYKKILDSRVNRQANQATVVQEQKEEVKTVETKNDSIDERMDAIINKINKKEVVKEEPKVVERKSIFTKEPSTYTPPKKVYTPVETKKTQPVKTYTSSKPKGYFVQIGAFSKRPSNSYIQKIKNAKLKYTIYKVEVKGRFYNKVLIGPYSSKAVAKQNINTIKSKLNITSAYVLKF